MPGDKALTFSGNRKKTNRMTKYFLTHLGKNKYQGANQNISKRQYTSGPSGLQMSLFSRLHRQKQLTLNRKFDDRINDFRPVH